MKQIEAIEYLNSNGADINYNSLAYLIRKGVIKLSKVSLDKYLLDSNYGKIQPSQIFHHLHNTMTTHEAVSYIKDKGFKATPGKLYNAVKHKRLINSHNSGKYAFKTENLDAYIEWLKKYQEVLG